MLVIKRRKGTHKEEGKRERVRASNYGERGRKLQRGD